MEKAKIKEDGSSVVGFPGWIKCFACGQMDHELTYQKHHRCCPKCGAHHLLPVKERIELLTDEGSFKECFSEIVSQDPLNFIDQIPYKDRLLEARRKSGRNEAVITGQATLGGVPFCLAVFDFSFMGGSMGSAVGEKITCLIEKALCEKKSLVIVSASGGARMQESVFSLMQMAKTSSAIARFKESGLFYLSILTHPTTGGVTASFASLGDMIIAEKGALIGFAGPKVLEKFSGQKLPPGAQRAEFLKEKGMIDLCVERKNLRSKVAFFLQFFQSTKGTDSKDLAYADNRQPEPLENLSYSGNS